VVGSGNTVPSSTSLSAGAIFGIAAGGVCILVIFQQIAMRRLKSYRANSNPQPQYEQPPPFLPPPTGPTMQSRPDVSVAGGQFRAGERPPGSFASWEDDDRRTYTPARGVQSVYSWRESVSSPMQNQNRQFPTADPPTYEMSVYSRANTTAP